MKAKISIYEAINIDTNEKCVGLYIGTNPNDSNRHYLGTGYGNGQHEIDIETLVEVESVYPHRFQEMLERIQADTYGRGGEIGRQIN